VISQLTQKQQKLLAFLMLFTAGFVMIGLIAFPIWSINQHYDVIIDDMSTRLHILKRTTSAGQMLKPEFERLKKYHQSDNRYLKSRSDALAAAEIQKIIKGVIVPHGGEILSTQIINNKKSQLIQQITLKVRMKGGLDSLVTAFHKLETGNPSLFIDNLTIRSREVRRRRSVRKNEEPQQKALNLDIQYEISGYIRGND
jgi:general secretion pathway protein M